MERRCHLCRQIAPCRVEDLRSLSVYSLGDELQARQGGCGERYQEVFIQARLVLERFGKTVLWDRWLV